MGKEKRKSICAITLFTSVNWWLILQPAKEVCWRKDSFWAQLLQCGFCLLVLDSCSCCCLMQRSCFYKSSDATAVAICTAYSGSPWQNSEESDGTAWESGRPMFSYQIFCKWDVWALSSHLPLLSITPTPSVSYKIWIQLHRAYCFSYFMILGLSSLFLWLESFQSSSLFDSLFPYLLREQNARCLCIMNPLVAKN